jgi:ribosomal-protein-alanine N-acetyltransferase
VILRPVTEADLDALAMIHAAAFEAPWSRDDLRALINAPVTIALLAEDESPFAFVLLRVVADEAEVLTIATCPSRRRAGAGAALMTAAAAMAEAAGACALFLEVAEDNLAGRALYAKLGFQAAGLRQGYYKRRNGAVDARVLRRELHIQSDWR